MMGKRVILRFNDFDMISFGCFQIFVEAGHELTITMECEGVKRVCKYERIFDPDDYDYSRL